MKIGNGVFLSLVLCIGCGATVVAQESVNAGFGNAQSEFGSVTYSVGQLFFSSGSDRGMSFYEGMIYDLFPQVPVGAEEGLLGGGLRIWPTSFEDRVTVQLPAKVEQGVMRVYDSTGRMVLLTRLDARSSVVNLSAFAQGMYWGRIECGGRSHAVKLIKR